MRVAFRVLMMGTLLLTTSTGVVMASSTACRVAVFEEMRSAQTMVHRRVHHTAATLARWKVGAAAWSKAHGGKVYAGVPKTRRADWNPLTFQCADVALDLSQADEGLLLPIEVLPEFAERERAMSPGSGLDLTAARMPPADDTWEQAAERSFFPYSGVPGPGGGNVPDGFGGSASFPSGPVIARLTTPIPTPESPTIMLVGTGMLSFLVSKLRRRTVV